MASRSVPNLELHGEASTPEENFFHRNIKASARCNCKPHTYKLSAPITFTHVSPPYEPRFSPTPTPSRRPSVPHTHSTNFSDRFSSASEKHHPPPRASPPALTRSTTSLNEPSTPKEIRAWSFPTRNSSLPARRPKHIVSRLASSISLKIFSSKETGDGDRSGKEEDVVGAEEEAQSSSLHLELPASVSRDKSEIEYLRRMEREALEAKVLAPLKRVTSRKETFSTRSRRTTPIGQDRKSMEKRSMEKEH